MLLAALLMAHPLAAQAPAEGFGIGAARTAPVPRPQTGLRVVPIMLAPAGKKPLTYRVELAATPEQQAIGMMHRPSMAPRSGMLFPMNPPREAAFWMRNTLIPLDLVFIGPDRRVIRIGADAKPLSEALIPSGGPVIAVLELAGGEAARVGLRPGDRVSW